MGATNAIPFYCVRVGNHIYEAVLSPRAMPYLCCLSTGHGVQLGRGSLRWLEPHASYGSGKGQGWWLVRYNNEPRLFLENCGTKEAQWLADEFGFYPYTEDALFTPARAMFFYTSPVWHALRDFVANHVRVLGVWPDEFCLGSWAGRLKAELEAQRFEFNAGQSKT